VGRIIEIDTDIAIFEKTETDTDSIFRKTEKYRLREKKIDVTIFFDFSSVSELA